MVSCKQRQAQAAGVRSAFFFKYLLGVGRGGGLAVRPAIKRSEGPRAALGAFKTFTV